MTKKGNKMKVSNLINKNGRAVPNQFVIEDELVKLRELQSYKSRVVSVYREQKEVFLYDDWDYSNTTVRAVNKFLSDELGDMWNSSKIRKTIAKGSYTDKHGIEWKFEECGK